MNNYTTKNDIKARLYMIQDLADAISCLADGIVLDLLAHPDDEDPDLMFPGDGDFELESIIIGMADDAEETIKFLEENGYFEKAVLKEGPPVDIPRLEVINNSYNVLVPVGGGHIGLNCSDCDGTPQVGITYEYGDEDAPDFIDLVMAEVKKGDLAVGDGLSRDNNDVDIYLYEDPYNEDFTRKTRISYDDIKDALTEGLDGE